MKKLLAIVTMLVLALYFNAQVMAQEIVQPNYFDTAFDARVYHESMGPGSSVGGWKFGLSWWAPSTSLDVDTINNKVRYYNVEFVNTVTGDTYSTKPHYCYDTLMSGNPHFQCDANVWFGNRMNVSDTSFVGSPMAVFDVYINEVKQNISLTPVFDENINAFDFPEILSGKNSMKFAYSPTGVPSILIYYTTPIVQNTTLKLIIYSADYTQQVYTQAPIIQGGQKFLYVSADYSGLPARLQMSTNAGGPTVRKSVFFKLP